ncbi:MAG: hypothetical protein KatS3mg011_2383 [Acidimicrobiia bacterium]|nr:MAG: hypothetical protein KatS3mg011_2383 [Acidimicrobiia bacterium]
MNVAEDLPHPVPPQAFMLWKENWVWPALDTRARVATLFHISLRPQLGEGVFTFKASGEGWKHRYVGRSPIPRQLETFVPVRNERMVFRVEEPGERFFISYRSEELDADFSYRGRFPTWDFHHGPRMPGESPLGEMGLYVFHFYHQEQGLEMEGELRFKRGVMAGEHLAVSGYGNRDHSWGWRDDFAFRRHHWICASFPDKYLQGSCMNETFYPGDKFGGFVSDQAGNIAVAHVDTSSAYWLEPGEPLGPLDQDVTYQLRTVEGRTYTLTAHISSDYGRHWLNARSDDRSQVYMDCQIFCDYTLAETGERGSGVLEVGKHLHGEGVADTVGRPE